MNDLEEPVEPVEPVDELDEGFFLSVDPSTKRLDPSDDSPEESESSDVSLELALDPFLPPFFFFFSTNNLVGEPVAGGVSAAGSFALGAPVAGAPVAPPFLGFGGFDEVFPDPSTKSLVAGTAESVDELDEEESAFLAFGGFGFAGVLVFWSWMNDNKNEVVHMYIPPSPWF